MLMASSSSEDLDLPPSSSSCGLPIIDEEAEKLKQEADVVKKEQKRRPKPRDGTQLHCGVCSDKALGYNFDAITCESCKAFFRRNANKGKSFTCSFDGNCKLDPYTRKFCSGCRLKKCFSIGMKKDWILSDEQLAKRRSRLRIRSSTSCSTSEQELPSSSRDSSSSCPTAEEPSHSSYHAQLPAPPDIVQIKEEIVGLENCSIPLQPDIKENLSKLMEKYNEIFEAAYSSEQSKNLKENLSNSNELFNMTDIFIRRLIKFAKCIPEFRELKQEDQIHLLKGGIMEMFVLRSAMGFDLQKGVWKYSAKGESGTVTEGKVDPRVVKSNLGSKMYTDHMQFVLSIHKLSNSDRIVLMLLFVIGLMCPDRPNLNDKMLINQAKEKFSVWMKAYLKSIYTISEAEEVYPQLMRKLLDVQYLGEFSSQLASTLDITRLEPLLVEVFDLKK